MNPTKVRKWLVVGPLSLSVLVVGLDLTVLNLALPNLAASLSASTGELQWIVDAYTLVLAAVLLPGGLLGDRYGRRRMLLVALVLFGASSVACAYAPSPGVLVAARAMLGVGAAVILPLSLSVLPVIFNDEERPTAIALVWGATFLSYPVGPLLGGWLLDNFWWGSVFLINVPVVVVAIIAVILLLPESRAAGRTVGVDVVGMVISGLGLAALTYGIIDAGERGWRHPLVSVSLACGAVLLVVFVKWERRVARRGRPEPLADLGLLRLPSFAWGTVLTTIVSFAMFGVLFVMPQYFQVVRHLTSFGSGVRLLPLIGGMIVGMAVSRRLQTPVKIRSTAAGRPLASARVVVALGFLCLAAGLAVGAMTEEGSGDSRAITWFVVAGAGLGLVVPAAMNAALAVLSVERSGAGTALITALRQVGASFGVAILGTVLGTAYRGAIDPAVVPENLAGAVRESAVAGVGVATEVGSTALLASVRSAFVHGLDVMLWTCAGLAVVAALLAIVFLPDVSCSEPTSSTTAAKAKKPPVSERS